MSVLISLFIGSLLGFTVASINAVNAYEKGYKDGSQKEE
jgi:hypothetical protein